jgi:hypothetical protein
VGISVLLFVIWVQFLGGGTFTEKAGGRFWYIAFHVMSWITLELALNVMIDAARMAGANPGVWKAHFFDAVPNIIGQGTLNPFKLIGSAVASPRLFMGPGISPHSTYLGTP